MRNARGARRPSPSRGFTLIEVLLAASLGVVLLGATFTAMQQYYNVEQRGAEQLQTAQVAFGLVRDLQGDLENLASIELAPLPNASQRLPQSSPNDLRLQNRLLNLASQFESFQENEFGERAMQLDDENEKPILMFGTSKQLVVTTRGTNPRFDNTWPNNKFVGKTPLSADSVDGTAFQTVVWCVGNGDPIRATLRQQQGYARETTISNTATRKGLFRIVIPNVSKLEKSITREQPPSVFELFPQANNLRFRYYDGDAWRNRWNTVELGRLPNAVEMTISITESPDQYRWVMPVVRGTQGETNS